MFGNAVKTSSELFIKRFKRRPLVKYFYASKFYGEGCTDEEDNQI